MKKSDFRFKQFDVAQNKCAMKVNTDGVLLGAWAGVSGAKHILDIGTGTGVIALMMAQKNTDAIIHAIDVDEDACNQAKENFGRSRWHNRLNAFCIPLQNFNPDVKYDVIISNPPYFIADQKTENHKRNVARHSVALTYEELLQGIARLLGDDGRALLVVPLFNFTIIESAAQVNRLFITAFTEVTAVTGKAPYLLLLQLERKPKEVDKTHLTIQDAQGIFTTGYKTLTKEFYLKF